MCHVCPVKGPAAVSPVMAFHTRIVRSKGPETMCWPSSENAYRRDQTRVCSERACRYRNHEPGLQGMQSGATIVIIHLLLYYARGADSPAATLHSHLSGIAARPFLRSEPHSRLRLELDSFHSIPTFTEVPYERHSKADEQSDHYLTLTVLAF